MSNTDANHANNTATEPPPRRWGLGDALLGLVVGMFGSSLAVGIYNTLVFKPPHGHKPYPSTLGSVAVGLAGLWLGLVGVTVMASRYKGSGSLRRDFGLWFKLPKDAIAGVALGFFCQYVLVALIYLPLRWIDPKAYHQLGDPAKQLTNVVSGWGWLALALLLLVGVPVAEELFFRGLVQRSLVARLGPRYGIPVAAAVFALAHLEPLQFPALLVFGLVVGIVSQRTKRLGMNIFAHVGFNAATLIALALAR